MVTTRDVGAMGTNDRIDSCLSSAESIIMNNLSYVPLDQRASASEAVSRLLSMFRHGEPQRSPTTSGKSHSASWLPVAIFAASKNRTGDAMSVPIV